MHWDEPGVQAVPSSGISTGHSTGGQSGWLTQPSTVQIEVTLPGPSQPASSSYRHSCPTSGQEAPSAGVIGGHAGSGHAPAVSTHSPSMHVHAGGHQPSLGGGGGPQSFPPPPPPSSR